MCTLELGDSGWVIQVAKEEYFSFMYELCSKRNVKGSSFSEIATSQKWQALNSGKVLRTNNVFLKAYKHRSNVKTLTPTLSTNILTQACIQKQFTVSHMVGRDMDSARLFQ